MLTRRVPLEGPLADAFPSFPRGRGGFVAAAQDARGQAFTMLGAEPTLALRAHRDDGDPFEALRRLLRERRVRPTGSPLPWAPGAFGYVGYECAQRLERLPGRPRPSEGLPDLAVFFHEWILGQCDATGETWLSVLGEDAESTFARVSGILKGHSSPSARTTGSVHAHTPRAHYLEHVATAKAHIRAGDAFEICLTHRLDVPFDGDAFTLWQSLRRANPAPRAAFLDLPEGAVVSASPERFLHLDSANIAHSRPIKGTRPRGETPETDDALAEQLRTSPKDRAENAMIVDVVRNDFGRVCRFGSVTTPEVLVVETHPSVHQLVSTIRGELDPDRDAIDLLRACFPPASMTGAPKIEAMTILEDLEPTERGVYSGALGAFGYDGTLDLSVVIRTIVVREGLATLHVGGAIVSDSDPASEWDETMVKARASLLALGAP